MSKRLMAMVATLALIGLVTGCGKKDSGSEPLAEAQTTPVAESSAAPKGNDHLDACQLRMTSPDAKEWKTIWDRRASLYHGEGPSFVHSTYWIRDEDHQTYVDNKAPPLDVTCSVLNDAREMEIGVTIAARGGLKEADVPYGPGTYPIVARSADPDAPKGLWAYPVLYGNALFEASGGTLTLTRFDANGIAGSFHVEGKEQIGDKRTIVIDGTFDMPCRGGLKQEKCTAGKAIFEDR